MLGHMRTICSLVRKFAHFAPATAAVRDETIPNSKAKNKEPSAKNKKSRVVRSKAERNLGFLLGERGFDCERLCGWAFLLTT
jgi:hypothetical protein